MAGSGAESQNLVQQAADTGSRNILFAGQVTDAEKRALYEGAQAVVLPSHLRSEAFGMVLVEASMYGKPMISCEVGSGTSFVNNDGETGFVVEPASPLALTSAMNALLHDLSMRHEMGAAARQRYERLFSGPALGRAYAQLFDEVLS
ncbi:glycosyltransferase [Chlorobium phaeovibrioides]|uniref:glycosyltransferase n=1 Tax=Chlorobium phaeovibrioides TaxID=1094 RepID=UPI0021F19A0E|nr:glycosyltransferase [Chlorobium phaeovibrioides]